MPLTHGVNLGHVLLVPESVSSQLTMPPLRKPKASLLPKSRSPAEIFGRSTLSGLIEALAWPAEASRAPPISNGTTSAVRTARVVNLDIALLQKGWLVVTKHYAA